MSKLTTNTTDLQAILDKVNALPEQESVELQEKTVSPTESAQTVTPDGGYDGLSQVTVNAIPSNYEDVTDETAVYTTSLTDLESVINSLPEAGSGGAAVETCTVTINYIASSGWEMLNFVDYATLRDGVIIHVSIDIPSKSENYMGGSKSVTLENIVCNSFIRIVYETSGAPEITTDGDIYLSISAFMGETLCCAETAAGGTITITS